MVDGPHTGTDWKILLSPPMSPLARGAGRWEGERVGVGVPL